jgi:hypothetical protein
MRHEEKSPSTAEVVRKAYVKPALSEYGSVTELTAAVGPIGGTDSGTITGFDKKSV